MNHVMYELDYRWMGFNARRWRAERRSKRRRAFADRMLFYSAAFMVAVSIGAYFSAAHIIAKHERDFCFAIAECPKV